MQMVKKRNLQFCKQKFVERLVVVFELLLYFFVNLSSTFVIQERLDPLSNRRV